MAASNIRSLPARPTVHDRLGIFSSSPSLPDLRDLVATKPKPKAQTVRSGSAAVPIPTNASTAFTSASDLLRNARASGDNSFDVIDEPDLPVARKAPAKRVRNTTKDLKESKQTKAQAPGAECVDVAKKTPAKRVRKTTKESEAPKTAKAPRPKKEKAPKRLAKEVITLSSDGVTPKLTRHEDAAAAETDTQDGNGRQENEGTPLKAKPWKKFKAITISEQPGTQEAEAACAKPLAKAKAPKKKTKSETVSRHFSKEKEPVEPEIPDAKGKRPRAAKAPTPEPINLEPAVQRRMDWTPVKADTLMPPSSSDPFGTPEDLLDRDADGKGIGAALFEKLRDTYGHKSADAAAAPKRQPGQVLGKRKVITMVSVNSSIKPTEASRESSPAKAKAPKKKPRTITELATAAYGPQVEEESHQEDSLLGYFSVERAEQDATHDSVAVKGKGKGKGKASKVNNSKKKIPPKKPVLLSPQAAMRQSAAQDFVFGTASQLAREESPTFLKDLHAAMKASTIVEEDDPFASPMTGIVWKSKPQGKGLWSISTRDQEGELVDVEIVDMINSPALPQDDAILDPWTQLPPEAAGPETETADSSVIEIDSRPVATNEDNSSQAPVPKSHFFMSKKMTINAAAALSPKIPDELFPMITDLLEDEMPPPSNQQQTQEEVRDTPSKAPAQKPRPKYESFTDAKLAKEISKFGFKAVKTRTGMIALLHQCWKSKSQASLAGASFAATSVLASPKRKQTDAAHDAPKTTPPAKKARGQAKGPANVDTVDAEVPKGVRARKGSAVAEDEPSVPKKKLIRPRKDAAGEDVSAVPKKKLGRLRQDAAAEDQAAPLMPRPSKSKAGPSTPKGKKAATQPVRDAEELDLDSEIEASCSSPEQLFSPGGTGADVTISDDTEISLNLSPTALQSTVFSYITKAVTSAPRTRDPQNPSWHEKMLMYDPVILEDLAAWLNSGELTKLGHDDEVSPQDVKKWCESRSICCLWKGNWRGKERKRF